MEPEVKLSLAAWSQPYSGLRSPAVDTMARERDALRERLPGYLVPRLVREVAGAPCKLPLGNEQSMAMRERFR